MAGPSKQNALRQNRPNKLILTDDIGNRSFIEVRRVCYDGVVAQGLFCPPIMSALIPLVINEFLSHLLLP